MMTPGATRRHNRPRRLLVLGIALAALFVLLVTCVVVAQSGNYGDEPIGGGDRPSRASHSASASEDSGPPATPWQQISWRDGTKKNQIIAISLPPKPSTAKARKDPLRVSVALLAALDSTNPGEWRPGVNPLRGYMSPRLDKTYTPPKGEGGEGEDPGDSGAKKLPDGAQADYEFYCHVASHSKKSVVSRCAFHVTTSSADKVLRDEDGVEQDVTAKRARDGWRVAQIEPTTGAGGD